MNAQGFRFEIPLSVLDHLGRKLYRSFVTVLGEAISNSWDADAKNVWIYVDKDNAALLIKDDGLGMTGEQFQKQFLKVGYSKRKGGITSSPSGRPFIGRKGIGKLALLSAAEKIAILTKTAKTNYIGGLIDNEKLDDAINDDLKPDEYPLEAIKEEVFSDYTKSHQHGTIIHFENVRDGIRNTLDHLKKVIALYFRFSLVDDTFNIYVNDELIDHSCLRDLMNDTQFTWTINDSDDPYVKGILENFTEEDNEHGNIKVGDHNDGRIGGFIASTKKPRNLNIFGTGEQISVDLFVNGRLRERDILRHIPSARVVESYLYGQIHFDSLDDGEDRFTSSREGVVPNDPKFLKLLAILRDSILRTVLNDWDTWRRKHRDPGDPDNPKISPKQRNSEALFNVVAKEYSEDVEAISTEKGAIVDNWVDELHDDAAFNFTSYAECFISENLTRRYLTEQSIQLTGPAEKEVERNRRREKRNKADGNVSIDIRRIDDPLAYLDMEILAKVADNTQGVNDLVKDSKAYKPLRDAVMHTAQLSDKAKQRLTAVFDNIKARVKQILSG